MAAEPVVLNLDGYTDIPAGKVVAVVTYLQMHERPASAGHTNLEGLTLESLSEDVRRYRAVYSRIGDPWLWFGRADWDDDRLGARLRHPDVEAFALVENGVDIGLLELDFRTAHEAELAYFGLVPGTTGKGVGRSLMDEAIRRVFARPVKRFFVHTCSLDHPAAVGFYVKSGFRAYKRAIEVADDPRLAGSLPLTSAPQVPIIHPDGQSA